MDSGKPSAGFGARADGGKSKADSGKTGAEGGKSAPADPPAKKQKYRAPTQRKKLTFSEQREYDTLEGIIDELTEKSEQLAADMAQASTDYKRLQELAQEKQKIDEELEEKIERFLTLQELVESFQN